MYKIIYNGIQNAECIDAVDESSPADYPVQPLIRSRVTRVTYYDEAKTEFIEHVLEL